MMETCPLTVLADMHKLSFALSKFLKDPKELEALNIVQVEMYNLQTLLEARAKSVSCYGEPSKINFITGKAKDSEQGFEGPVGLEEQQDPS